MNRFIPLIESIAKDLPHTKIMEVCGGHTNTIMRYGINSILPDNIELVSGPGCPVCVTSQRDIDNIIHIALSGEKVCTYGDMLHVPGTLMSLDDARSKGADVKMVVSATDALKYPDHVFFGIGFETTTPMTAFLLDKGITVYSSHKIMPPPMRFLAESESEISGFIDPGHVSTITGSRIWEQLDIPQVIAGFKPDQMVRSIYKLLKLIRDEEKIVINDYPEVVTSEGNLKAKALIDKTLKISDSGWRGFGMIRQSGLEPKDPDLDAKMIFKDLLEDVESEENPACRCGEVIRGLISPRECPLFSQACTPESPKGACMVSPEGACNVYFRYRR